MFLCYNKIYVEGKNIVLKLELELIARAFVIPS